MRTIEQNGILYPEKALSYDCEVPAWDDFIGNNHKTITGITTKLGGGLHVGRHIGKPLSKELWKDLVGRLGIRHLRIYKLTDWRWTDSPIPNTAHIDLDENGNVVDFWLWM